MVLFVGGSSVAGGAGVDSGPFMIGSKRDASERLGVCEGTGDGSTVEAAGVGDADFVVGYFVGVWVVGLGLGAWVTNPKGLVGCVGIFVTLLMLGAEVVAKG